MSLYRYTFIDEDGDSTSDYSTSNFKEADDFAREHGWAVVENEYEWVDSEIVADHRPPAEDEE